MKSKNALAAKSKDSGLSSNFAATLAQELNALLVTGDPEFKAVESQVGVMWLPRQ